MLRALRGLLLISELLCQHALQLCCVHPLEPSSLGGWEKDGDSRLVCCFAKCWDDQPTIALIEVDVGCRQSIPRIPLHRPRALSCCSLLLGQEQVGGQRDLVNLDAAPLLACVPVQSKGERCCSTACSQQMVMHTASWGMCSALHGFNKALPACDARHEQSRYLISCTC